MASLKELKKRITSVKGTAKITRAMKLVSAAKLRRATDRAQSSRPYEIELKDIISTILRETEWVSPLTRERPAKKIAFLVISSDRGLCGSLNTNLFKKVLSRVGELPGVEIEIVALGKKAKSFFEIRGFKIAESHIDLMKNSAYEQIEPVFNGIEERFLSGEYDRIEVFYNQFQSAMVQNPELVQLLPYQLPQGESSVASSGNYILEPHGPQLLEALVPSFIRFQFFRFILESIASEHGARMLSMENATKNAGEMISKLTLQRNRARQAAITTELMEIISGAEALSG